MIWSCLQLKYYYLGSLVNNICMSKKKRINIVYSTADNFDYDFEEDVSEKTLDPDAQKLYVSIDRKKRAGKEVTLVEGFIGDADDLKDLAKFLKSKCGVGGAAKNGEILIQGNFKDKVYDLLISKNYSVKKKGGN